MKGKALALMLILAISCSVLIGLVTANPIPYLPTPNTDAPTLAIQTPRNYSDTYAQNIVILNFTVTKPDSWNFYHLGIPVIGCYYVEVYLDGNHYADGRDPVYEAMSETYPLVLDGLTSETHTLTIMVFAETYSSPTWQYSNANVNRYHMNVSDTIHFTLNADSKTILFSADPIVENRDPYPSLTSSPSPSPTPSPTETPSPSPSPTASPSPTPSPEPQTEPFPTALVIAIVVLIVIATIALIVVVCAGLLVYFKKHKSLGEQA